METEILADFQLLFAGCSILAAVAATIIVPCLWPGPRGRLNRQRRELRYRRYRAQQAERELAQAQRRLRKLESRARDVKPVTLQSARDRVTDLQTLGGHALDKVLVAENLIRRTLLDEFPPSRQEQMLARYVSTPDGRSLPFRF